MRTLGECFPELVDELATLLLQEDESGLLEQLPTLPIIERCRCGHDFCATIYTSNKEERGSGIRRTIPLHPESGYLKVDTRDKRIVCIQVLFRDEVRRELLKLLP